MYLSIKINKGTISWTTIGSQTTEGEMKDEQRMKEKK